MCCGCSVEGVNAAELLLVLLPGQHLTFAGVIPVALLCISVGLALLDVPAITASRAEGLVQLCLGLFLDRASRSFSQTCGRVLQRARRLVWNKVV